jgi:hypothetical protein
VTLAFARARPGTKVKGKCKKRRPKGKRCTRYKAVGKLKLKGHAGLNRLHFEGRLSKKRSLRPGRYRLRARARDAQGRRSPVASLRFRVLRAKH